MDDLRKIKSSRPALNRAMREIGIEPYWILNPGTEKRTIEGSAKLGEDTFEALVGAIYLDKGFTEAEAFVRRHLLKTPIHNVIK
jgi:ribonuclease-3